MEDRNKLSFEQFDYDSARAKLPDEYEPLESITVPFNSQARVKEKHNSDGFNENSGKPIILLNSYEPSVYRFFSHKEHLDAFFEKGELLISNLDRCKTDEVGERCDINETKNRIILKDGDKTIDMVMSLKETALILCTSLSSVGLKEDGSVYEYGFKIIDTFGFIDILTRALVTFGIKVKEVLKGPCVYDNKLITLDVSGSCIANDFLNKSNNGILDSNTIMDTTYAISRNHIYMNKPTKFDHENEYRFVWFLEEPIDRITVSDNVTINDDGSIIVRVPELVEFCERI